VPDVLKWVFHRHQRHQRHALSRQRLTSALLDVLASRHRHSLRHGRRSSRSGTNDDGRVCATAVDHSVPLQRTMDSLRHGLRSSRSVTKDEGQRTKDKAGVCVTAADRRVPVASRDTVAAGGPQQDRARWVVLRHLRQWRHPFNGQRLTNDARTGGMTQNRVGPRLRHGRLPSGCSGPHGNRLLDRRPG